MNTFYTDFDHAVFAGPGPQPPQADDHRSLFQIDRDRIIFSFAFRRLQSKTQVFQWGDYDFYRTRLTHSIEVARIGRSICEYLRANQPDLLGEDCYVDPDLVEAVGLAHDLGHPPFGHIGERRLNRLMQPYGGFEGNAQTLRLLTDVIYERRAGPRGMRPTRAFLDGTLKYKTLWSEACRMQGDNPPQNHFLYDCQKPVLAFVQGGKLPPPQARRRSLECLIIDWADDAAYSFHDLLDGVQAGYLNTRLVENWAAQAPAEFAHHPALPKLLEWIGRDSMEGVFGRKIGECIRACRLAPVESTGCLPGKRYAYTLQVDPQIRSECQLYQRIAADLIFLSPRIQRVEFKCGRLLERLFNALADQYLTGTPGKGSLKLLPEWRECWIGQADSVTQRARILCDFLAGLTDPQAIRLYRQLHDPDFGSLSDL